MRRSEKVQIKGWSSGEKKDDFKGKQVTQDIERTTKA